MYVLSFFLSFFFNLEVGGGERRVAQIEESGESCARAGSTCMLVLGEID